MEDIRQASEHVLDFSKDKELSDYKSDALLRSGIERQFEIIGEAVNRLARAEPDVANQISHYKRVISFRNILIHGYDIVEHPVVWDVVTNDLPSLYEQVRTLLGKDES
ncbi:MAG: hypothetical protein CEE38_04800 [Planctomycetes bacterium B3_Pla]|nr:MAG: hypothetical protein CEE38_04800 [Planctomycetes bacterium B3_Pla]